MASNHAARALSCQPETLHAFCKAVNYGPYDKGNLGEFVKAHRPLSKKGGSLKWFVASNAVIWFLRERRSMLYATTQVVAEEIASAFTTEARHYTIEYETRHVKTVEQALNERVEALLKTMQSEIDAAIERKNKRLREIDEEVAAYEKKVMKRATAGEVTVSEEN
jgi:hypothetical protein